MNNQTSVRIDYFAIPHDFPKPKAHDHVPIAKFLLDMDFYRGKYYPEGCTPPQTWELWQVCDELANHLKTECLEEKTKRSPLLSEEEILDVYFARARELHWGSEAEIDWVFSCVATMLRWSVPRWQNS